MGFFLNRKGAIEFVFSKLIFIIFGILVCGALFSFFQEYTALNSFDGLYGEGIKIKKSIDSLISSPFNAGIELSSDFEGNVEFNDSYFVLTSGGRTLKFNFIGSSGAYGSFDISCMKIVKADSIEVSSCH